MGNCTRNYCPCWADHQRCNTDRELDASITGLRCSIDVLNQNMARNEERITHHGKQIDDHEHRITVLEQKEEAHENG